MRQVCKICRICLKQVCTLHKNSFRLSLKASSLKDHIHMQRLFLWAELFLMGTAYLSSIHCLVVGTTKIMIKSQSGNKNKIY